LSALPPPVTESQFRDLEGASKEQVRKRAAPFVSDLQAFLNHGSCLSDVQSIRRSLNPRIKDGPAFDDFAVDYEHWYTYNTGGRNEAQFNLGLFPDYFRVGMGFEFTEKMYGEPARVQTAYGAFSEVLRQHRRGFDKFARKNLLWVEWRPEGKMDRASIKYVRTDRVLKWLLRPQVSNWIFVGRLLDRKGDAEILGDQVRLKEAMESVFRGFKPLWQEAQTASARYP
jgi:hypothetical protein